jgi:hypothetical protein
VKCPAAHLGVASPLPVRGLLLPPLAVGPPRDILALIQRVDPPAQAPTSVRSRPQSPQLATRQAVTQISLMHHHHRVSPFAQSSHGSHASWRTSRRGSAMIKVVATEDYEAILVKASALHDLLDAMAQHMTRASRSDPCPGKARARGRGGVRLNADAGFVWQLCPRRHFPCLPGPGPLWGHLRRPERSPGGERWLGGPVPLGWGKPSNLAAPPPCRAPFRKAQPCSM